MIARLRYNLIFFGGLMSFVDDIFGLDGKTAIVAGGAGVILYKIHD